MNLEGIFSFAILLYGYVGFICWKMGVSPLKLWTYDSRTERDS